MKTIRNTICIVLLLILLFFTTNVNADNSTSLVNGQVYIDEDINEILDDKDTVLKGIEIVLTRRVNNVVTESGLEIEEYEPVSTAVSDEKGYFTFEINEKELYRIKIKTSSLLPGYTYERIDINYESSLKNNNIALRLTKLPEKIYDVSKMTSIDLIDQAYDKAEITEDEKMWLYAKYYKDDELPERYRSDIEGPDKADIHFVLNQYIVINDDKELDEYVHGIPQDEYNYLPMGDDRVSAFLDSEQPNQRYINTVSPQLDECYILELQLPTDDTPLDLTQITGKIMFYYPSTLNASVIGNIAEWTEEVLSELLTENGVTGFFNLAYSDIEKDGNNNYINVYLGAGTNGWAGSTPVTLGSPATSSGDIFIGISGGRTEESYKKTFAHEFAHIVEYSLNRSLFINSPVKSNGFPDALAMYVEDWTQELSQENLFLFSSYFENTDLPLYSRNSDTVHNEYGAVTFLWYIDRKYSSTGNSIAQEIFSCMGNSQFASGTWWNLLGHVLVEEYNTSLSDEFSEYSSVLYHIECVNYFDRYFLDPDDPDTNDTDWNALLNPGLINSYPYTSSSQQITQLSSHYYKFAPSGSSPTAMRVGFDGANDGMFDNDFAVYIYSETIDGSIIVDQYTNLDSNNDVYYTRRNINETYESMGVCVSNPDWQNQAQYELYNISCDEHILSSWTVATVSTCSTLGEMTRHCTSGGCGYSETFAIPQNPDNHVGPLESIITKSATCTEPGESILKCTICQGTASTTEIEILGHNYTVYQNTSYQVYSSTQHKVITQNKCSRCTALKNDIQYVSHTYNVQAATCNTAKYCTVCGYVDQAILAHSYSAATCELPAACTRCGVTGDGPLGHDMGSWYTVTASTCCTYGTQRSDCSRSGCGYYETGSLSYDSSNHSGGSHTEVLSNPTCTADGSQREVCDGCSAVLNTSSIPATGHSMPSSWSVTTPSTCCVPGTKTRSCSNSGCSYSENDSLPLNPSNHSGGTYWTVTTAATCTTSGIRSQICYGCSAVLSTQPIPILDHSWGSWIYQYRYYDEDLQYYVRVYTRTCSSCGAVEYDYME